MLKGAAEGSGEVARAAARILPGAGRVGLPEAARAARGGARQAGAAARQPLRLRRRQPQV